MLTLTAWALLSFIWQIGCLAIPSDMNKKSRFTLFSCNNEILLCMLFLLLYLKNRQIEVSVSVGKSLSPIHNIMNKDSA